MVEHLFITVLEEKWHLGCEEGNTCYSRDLLTGKSSGPILWKGREIFMVLKGAGQWRTWPGGPLGGTQKSTHSSPDPFPSAPATLFLQNFPRSSHPASVVSHGCSEHLCSVQP